MDPIVITEPVSIRSYVSGGKGGFGYSSSQWHRLVERRVDGDRTACGFLIRSQQIAIRSGSPTQKMLEQHGKCARCWP